MRLIKNGSVDLSLENQDEADTISLGANTYYVAQLFPFNNLFFHLSTLGTLSNAVQIYFWSGREWTSVVDVIDGTRKFHRSGNIQFNMPDDKSWQSVDDTSKSSAPSELNAFKIYNCYWLKIVVNTDAVLKEIGYCFSSTQQLKHYDIEINNYMASFDPSKTDWIDELKTSSKMLVLDLKRMGLVVDYGEILLYDDVSLACDFKTLSMIYSNLGPAYDAKRNWAEENYKNALQIKRFSFDTNSNAKLDSQEIANRVKQGVR
jgi:hypothetical protein